MPKTVETRVIGTHSFDTASLELRDGSGAVVPLRPQSSKVLGELVAAEGNLVSKSDLMERVWSDTFVTDDSLVQCISDIRKGLGADGALLVTVPKRGYRLEASDAPVAVSDAFVRRRGAPWIAAALAVLILFVAAAVWLMRPAPPTGAPRTIAVLPFRNDSGDADQAYLSNGIAEDLIVSLSRISDLRVVSRGTSFGFTGEGDLREVAARLEADVILEGGVRQVGERLRLTASLVDGGTGANLWANAYEGARSEIFDFQEEVLEELVRVLSVRLSRSERARLGVRGTESVEAHDAYLFGREQANSFTKDANLAAERALQRAIRLDPDFALARAHLAQIYSFRVEYGWAADRQATVDRAFAEIDNAIDLDPKLPFARFVRGRMFTRSYAHALPDAVARAKAEYAKALELDPNYVDAYLFLANIHIFDGEAEAALPLIESAFARNPIPPFWYDQAEGMARYFLGEYEAAEAALVSARDKNPSAPHPYRMLIATQGQMGHTDDADWTAMEYEALGRNATVEAILSSASVSDPGYREKFADGLRKAGLPEM